MVVPVPVVLQKSEVRTLPDALFERIDKLAAPRLVEYWEQDPCSPRTNRFGTIASGSGTGSGFGRGGGGGGQPKVTVEAQFVVGEYDIVILGARDATALESWLTGHGYRIPDGAAPYLKPYHRHHPRSVPRPRYRRGAGPDAVFDRAAVHRPRDGAAGSCVPPPRPLSRGRAWPAGCRWWSTSVRPARRFRGGGKSVG